MLHKHLKKTLNRKMKQMHMIPAQLKADLCYNQLNETQGRKKSGDLFSTTCPSQLSPLCAVLSASVIPLHGHDSGGGGDHKYSRKLYLAMFLE